MGNTLTRWWDFDKKFQEKGSKLLDTILDDHPDLRPNVTFVNPRYCHQREVVFGVEYDSPADLATVLTKICAWMRNNPEENELDGLMLY